MSETTTVREAEAAREAERRARWAALVAEAAGGADLDPGDVLELLDDLGKTAEDLDREVAKREERARLREELHDLPRLERRRLDLLAEARALAEAHEAKARAFHDAHRQLLAEAEELLGRMCRRDAVERRLRETGDPDVLRRWRAAQERAGRRRDAAAALRREAAAAREYAQQAASGASEPGGRPDAAKARARARKGAELEQAAKVADAEAQSAAGEEAALLRRLVED